MLLITLRTIQNAFPFYSAVAKIIFITKYVEFSSKLYCQKRILLKGSKPRDFFLEAPQLTIRRLVKGSRNSLWFLEFITVGRTGIE